VTLSFEEPEQYANPVRLRAFVRDWTQYTVLLAGTLVTSTRGCAGSGSGCIPTTFFVGRDGLVKASTPALPPRRPAVSTRSSSRLHRDHREAAALETIARLEIRFDLSARSPGIPQRACGQ